LATKLNVPLETVDDQTKILLENLTKQLGLVARQGAAQTMSTLPPELREEQTGGSQSNIPPELRQAPPANIPPELRSQQTAISLNPESETAKEHDKLHHKHSVYSNKSHQHVHSYNHTHSGMDSSDANAEYSTSYPPVEIDDDKVSSIATLTVEYGHGKNRVRGSDAISESVLTSLQTDISSGMSNHSNGAVNTLSSSNTDKDRLENSSSQRHMNSNRGQQAKAGNGFLPRQLQSRPNNNYGRQQQQRPLANRQPHHMFNSRGGEPNSRPNQQPHGNQTRKW